MQAVPPMSKEFEDQFMQSAEALKQQQQHPHHHQHQQQTAALSQNAAEFEPYLSQYAEYDSMLSESMSSSVRDLGISTGRYDNNNGSSDYDDEVGDMNQMTITPASLAKISKYLNSDAFKSEAINSSNNSMLLTPENSPVKNVAQSNNDNAKSGSSTMAAAPPPCDLSQRNVPFATPDNSPDKNRRLPHQQTYDSESESGLYFSSPEAMSPAQGGTSPEMQQQSMMAPNPNMTSSMDVYSSLDMSQMDPKSAQMINWQPVVTASVRSEAQEIIKAQQTTVKASSRKSCLPPGKVDSFLVGPNEEGMFECLYPDCGKFFKRRYNVRSHIQTHLCDRPYSCDDCGACFVRPHDLRRHAKCHKSDRPFVCPCGKAFTRHDALQRHRIRLICSGGIEIPGRPKRVPAKRGRPRKNPLPNSANNSSASNTNTSESEASPVSSPESFQMHHLTGNPALDMYYDGYSAAPPPSGGRPDEFMWR